MGFVGGFPRKRKWTLYLDMDGVLADFDAHHEAVFGHRPCKTLDNVDWSAVRATPNFYAGIPPMPDLDRLLDYTRPFQPVILTGVPPSVSEARDNKLAWVRQHVGQVPVITCRSREKFHYAQPGDILIDDWEKYRPLWEGAGGRWITHKSAESTIRDLAVMVCQ